MKQGKKHLLEEEKVANKNNKNIQFIDKLKLYDQTQQQKEEAFEESLSVLLLQCLHNNDQSLIDYCLNQERDELINQTVSEIIPSKIHVLLDKILCTSSNYFIKIVIERLNKYSHNQETLLKWLSSLILQHTTYIIQFPETQAKLQEIKLLLKNKTTHFAEISKLKRKIEMILKQKEINNKVKSQNQKSVKIKPRIVYQEGPILAQNIQKNAIKKQERKVQQSEVQQINSKDGSSSQSENDDTGKQFDQIVAYKVNQKDQKELEEFNNSENSFDEFIES